MREREREKYWGFRINTLINEFYSVAAFCFVFCFLLIKHIWMLYVAFFFWTCTPLLPLRMRFVDRLSQVPGINMTVTQQVFFYRSYLTLITLDKHFPLMNPGRTNIARDDFIVQPGVRARLHLIFYSFRNTNTFILHFLSLFIRSLQSL